MDSILTQILLGDNPWIEEPGVWDAFVRDRLPGSFIPRSLEWRLVDDGFESERATLVVGPRQAGKSTLLWHAIHAAGMRALLVNCEELAVRQLARSPAIFLQELAPWLKAADALFLEEVQHLEEAGLFIKGLVDRKPGLPLLVTGSAAYDLRARTRESLAGRAVRFRLLPLSLREIGHTWEGLPEPAMDRHMDQAWQEQAVFGGYPEVWTSSRRELLLSQLVDAFIIRDASDLYRVTRPDAFRTLAQLLAGQVGNLVNFSEYAAICAISADTAASYGQILVDSHVLHLLRPFAGGRRAELTSRPKPYFVDCGIRNALVGVFQPLSQRLDRGPLLENWIFGELIKGLPSHADVRYWRTKAGAEVDFVIRRGEQLTGIEVKAAALSRRKITRSARSFIQAYHPADFVVVNTSLDARVNLDGTVVRWLRPHQLVDHIGSVRE